MEYLTRECYDKLMAELRQLETVELPRVREAISEARDKGDLSENYEYRAAKREQGRLLGRIRYQQRVLQYARVLEPSARRGDKTMLLSRIKTENLASHTISTYTLVSPHEANPREGKISVRSPIGQALVNREEGETVEVHVPAGTIRLKILEIE